jgi:hypothetical protein
MLLKADCKNNKAGRNFQNNMLENVKNHQGRRVTA